MVEQKSWSIKERPGYLGKSKDNKELEWNNKFGEGNWRYGWELSTGEVLNFEQVFWQVYVAGYSYYFFTNIGQALYLTQNYSFAYDKEMITREQAFDPYALYGQPGHPNQFHNVALNIALEWFLGYKFKGTKPIQVREGKPGIPIKNQPEGYLWSPGRIRSTRPELIDQNIEGWWQHGSIEDFYQSTKIVEVNEEAFKDLIDLEIFGRKDEKAFLSEAYRTHRLRGLAPDQIDWDMCHIFR